MLFVETLYAFGKTVGRIPTDGKMLPRHHSRPLAGASEPT